MKIRSLAIVAATFIITAVATPALAVYHPGMGRFLQRDPHGTMNAPTSPRVGMAGPAAAGGFVARDPMPSGTRWQSRLQAPSGAANSFAPEDRYADGMNLYQYVRSNPVNRMDPTGECSIESIKNAINLADQYLEAGKSLPFVFPLHKNNPHQHCVWNCRMTRVMGPMFSIQQSWKKELIDKAFADLRDSLQNDGCWCCLPKSVRNYVQASADSAFQPSDFYDNGMGIALGMGINDGFPWNDTKCEQACTNAGIGPNTAEGPGTLRPYGSRSQYPAWLKECP